MNNNTHKGWKPLVFKIAIIAMSICYVLGPSHNEVNKLLHVLTHQFEMPSNIISHPSVVNSDYKVHKTHILNKSKQVHNHKLLKLLDFILEASGTKHNKNNSKVITLKIDKHLINKKFYRYSQFNFSILIQYNFLFIEQKLHKGFRKDTIDPPQLV